MAEATIGHLIQEVRETSAQEQDKTQGVKDSVDGLVNQFTAFFKGEKAKAGDKAEAARESKGEKSPPIFGQLGDAVKEVKSLGFVGMIGAILGTISGLIAGTIAGFVDAARLILKGIGKPFISLGKRLINAYKVLYTGLFNGLTKAFTFLFPQASASIAKAVDATGDAIRSGAKGIQAGAKTATDTFTRISAQMKNVVTGVGQAFRNGLNGISSGIRGVNGQFRSLNVLDKVAKTTGGLITSVKNGASAFGGFLRGAGFGNFFDDIKKGFGAIRSTGAGVAKRISKSVKTVLTTLKKVRGVFGTFFRTFFTFARGLFFPITFIMSAFDAFKGFKEGYAAQGNSLIGGAIGAISGVLKGLIGMPLDLLKGIVGWIAGKFGMDGVQEFLASFSFTDLIGNLFNTITDTVLGFFDAMKDETGSFDFGKIVKTVVGALFNVVTAPIRMLMNSVADLADSIGFSGTADKIRGFAEATRFEGMDDAVEKRKENREQFEKTQAEKERLAKLEETPRDQSTQTLQETTTTQNNPVVINQVDASTKDMSVKTSASTSVVGDPTPAMDFSVGNRVAYV